MSTQAALLDYTAIAHIADTIARKTGLRALMDFEPLVQGMGGTIVRTTAKEWSNPKSISLSVDGQRDFKVFLPLTPSPIDRLLIACALGHYILHSAEGKNRIKITRATKDAASIEALWFGMAIVIPDEPFAIAENTEDLDDDTLAGLFSVQPELIRLKRKLISAKSNRAAQPQNANIV